MSLWRQHTWTLGLFALVSAAFSWPLVTDPAGLHISQQFDLYSLVWLLDAIGSGAAGLSSETTSWPVGESLNRMDSFVLAGLAWLGQGALSGRLLVGLTALLGPVVSAFAAERIAAEHFNARWPWSIIAGLAYGFTGMAATALLEGHVYALLNPWLPLLLGAMLSSTQPSGRAKDGLLAGLWWALALLTSAYTGIAATLLVLTVLVSRRPWKQDDLRPTLCALSTMLTVGLAYAAFFGIAGAGVRDPTQGMSSDPLKVMMAGSISLDSLASWNGITDAHRHSVTGALGFGVLSLSLMAPLVLKRTPRLLAALALIGVTLALGPQIEIAGVIVPGPMALLGLLGERASFFNFPSRMLWLAHLGLGLLGAVVASRLAERTGRRWALGLLGLCVLDVFIVTGAPLRTQQVPYAVPSIYSRAPAGRAIVELWPEFGSFGTDLALLTNNLGCAHQSTHQRPIANQCLGTTVGAGTRSLGRWLNASAYQADLAKEVSAGLGQMGFGAVILHPDLYTPQDRSALLSALTRALGKPTAETTDAGEHLVMFVVPQVQTSPALRATTYAQIQAAYP